MYLTTQIECSRYHSNSGLFKHLTDLSRDVFNHFNNIITLNYIHNNIIIPYTLLDKLIKHSSNLNNNNLSLINSLKPSDIQLLSFNNDDLQLHRLIGFSSIDYQVYSSLPIKSVQNIIKQLDQAWKSFNTKLINYNTKYNNIINNTVLSDKQKQAKLSKLHKDNPPTNKNNSNVIKLNTQQFKIINNSIADIIPSYLKQHNLNYKPMLFNIKYMSDNIEINEVRIIPKYNYFIFEIVYSFNSTQTITDNLNLNMDGLSKDLLMGYDIQSNQYYNLNKYKYASIDLGINNLCTITNNFNNNYLLINGRLIKSINHYTNKLISNSKKKKHPLKISNRMKVKIWKRRDKQINHYFHKVSNYIIKYCLENGIANLVIGYNKKWKDKVKMGRKMNQQFVGIPYFKLKSMLEYKSTLSNITLIEVNEWYTSKCSFLDMEKICKKSESEGYKGERPNRGKYYYTKNGYKIHADVNGSLNILRLGILKHNRMNKSIKDVDKGKIWWFDHKQRLTQLECILSNQSLNNGMKVDVSDNINGQVVEDNTSISISSSYKKMRFIRDVIVCPTKVKINIF